MSARSPVSAVLRRTSGLWKLKLAGTTLCCLAFMGFYFATQHCTWFGPYPIPATPVDRWVRFEPRWTLVYESLWLMLPIAPWLSGTRGDVRRYLVGFAFMCAVAFPLFVFYPVEAPRPQGLDVAHGPYRLLVSIDGLRNSLPSLHAALGVYSVLVAGCLLSELVSAAARRRVVVLGWGWLGLILYATLATRQHWFVDLPAGLLLGAVAYRVSGFHGSSRARPLTGDRP